MWYTGHGLINAYIGPSRQLLVLIESLLNEVFVVLSMGTPEQAKYGFLVALFGPADGVLSTKAAAGRHPHKTCLGVAAISQLQCVERLRLLLLGDVLSYKPLPANSCGLIEINFISFFGQ